MNAWAALPSAVRYPLSFGIPLLGTILLTPLAARAAHRIELTDLPRGRHSHARATPYLGGLAVAAGGLVAVGVVASGTEAELGLVLSCAALLGALGLLDDLRGVSPLVRFTYEGVCGLSLWLVGIRAGVFHVAGLDLVLTVLWVVAVTNAVNFIDNMDGLASGVAAMSALGIFAVAARDGDVLVASFALAVAGGSLGFLRHNFPPASIFLGDAGSMLLGFLLSALVLELDIPVASAAPRALTTALLAGVPLFDLALVVVARTAGRRPVYQGGTDHLSHRLKERGFTPREVAGSIIAAQALCSGLAIAASRASAGAATVATAALGAASIGLLEVFLRMPTQSRACETDRDVEATG